MLFNSAEFIFVFLPVVFVVYFLLNHWRASIVAKAWLVLASLVFYGWWSPFHLPLLIGSIYVNYRFGLLLEPGRLAPGRRRLALASALALNLLVLGWFKYADFVVVNVNQVFGTAWPLFEVTLPIGISFFTFTQIAWIVDRYQRKANDTNALDYVLFVTFFPHLIAGPILHHREMMSQFASRWTRSIRYRYVLMGLFLFAIGLFKKVALADTFALWANAGFDGTDPMTFFDGWCTSLSYSFQLYFDFSGYCDMALGASLLFNIWLPINFDSPYKALDIQDFWRRWHITLGRYLRDYVYVPLGGNRDGVPRETLNLAITFLIGGLWHGASWMFLIWGALHGAALIGHRVWTRRGGRLPRAAAWALTFLFVNATWVFFRARSLPDAWRVLRAMGDVDSIWRPAAELPTSQMAWFGTFLDSAPPFLPATLLVNGVCIAALACAFAIVGLRNSTALMRACALRARGVAMTWGLLTAALLVMISSHRTAFLYFNF